MWETNAGRRKRETLLGALGACHFLLLAVFASADYVILKNGKRETVKPPRATKHSG